MLKLFGLVLFACLVALMRIALGKPGRSIFRTLGSVQKARLPYAKHPLFSPAERSFLGVLEHTLGNNYRVFGKVRLLDLVQVDKGLNNSERQTAMNRIQSKHVDFVVCCVSDLAPRVAIELDDKSHNAPKRMERDRLVDGVFEAAGLPLVHFTVKETYQREEIAEKLIPHLATAAKV